MYEYNLQQPLRESKHVTQAERQLEYCQQKTSKKAFSGVGMTMNDFCRFSSENMLSNKFLTILPPFQCIGSGLLLHESLHKVNPVAQVLSRLKTFLLGFGTFCTGGHGCEWEVYF